MAAEKLPFIITIDGKSGVGKSELSDKLTKVIPKALDLSCVHFDTGLFFRALAYSLQEDGLDYPNITQKDLESYLSTSPFSVEFIKDDTGARIKYFRDTKDGHDKIELSESTLRSALVENVASAMGSNEKAAEWMKNERKRLIMNSQIDVVIINGRDTAANYFQDADLKIILHEEDKYRAKRRAWEKRLWYNQQVDECTVLAALLSRDEKDADLLKHNSSLKDVWNINRTGLSSRQLAALVTTRIGLILGKK